MVGTVHRTSDTADFSRMERFGVVFEAVLRGLRDLFLECLLNDSIFVQLLCLGTMKRNM
jgi:hypothetical protein